MCNPPDRAYCYNLSRKYMSKQIGAEAGWQRVYKVSPVSKVLIKQNKKNKERKKRSSEREDKECERE